MPHVLLLSGPAAMLLATLAFAVMGVFVKLAAAFYSPGEIVFYRSVVVAGLAAWMATRFGTGLRSAQPRGQMSHALLGGVALGLYFQAMVELPLATAVSLNYASSIWLGLIVTGFALCKRTERPSWASLGAVALGFVGMLLVLRPTIGAGQAFAGACGAVSGLAAALGYLQMSRLSQQGEPAYRTVFYFALSAALVGAVMATAVGWRTHSLTGVVWLAGVGLSAGAGQFLVIRAYATGDRIRAASLQYTGVAYAAVLGLLFFGDVPSMLALLGMVFIVAAALLCLRRRN